MSIELPVGIKRALERLAYGSAGQVFERLLNDAQTAVWEPADEEAMLGLSQAKTGDVAIRGDGSSFVLKAEPPSELANWVELSAGGGGGGESLGTLMQIFSKFQMPVLGDVANPETFGGGVTVSLASLGGGLYTATVAGIGADELMRPLDAFKLSGDADADCFVVMSVNNTTTATVISSGSPTTATPTAPLRWRGLVASYGSVAAGPLTCGVFSVFAIKNSSGEEQLVFWTGNNVAGWVGPANGTIGGFAGPTSSPNAAGWVMKKNDPAVYVITGTDASGDLILKPLVPSGGTTGQVLAKASSDDFDVEWVTP